MRNRYNGLKIIYILSLIFTLNVYSQTQNITSPGVYSWPATHVIIEFLSVPQGGGTVTVNEYLTAPSPAPPGGTVIPYYLEISTSMDENSFTAIVTIEEAATVGFNANTIVERPDVKSEGWLIIAGNYVPGTPDFFKFQVNRFSLFSFIIPTVAPKNLSICSDNTDPATTLEISPSDAGGFYTVADWGYTPGEQAFSVYVKPEDQSRFYGCDIYLRWNDDVIEFQSIEKGNLWSTGNFNFYTYPVNPADSIIIQAAAQNVLPANITVTDAKYIAKLNFKMIRPGFSPVEIMKCDFRDSLNSPLYFINNNFKVKYFLGDFSGSTSERSGDGQVDFDDLSLFSLVYNSSTTGWSGNEWLPTGTAYKRKYDIGPTDGSHYIYDIPQPDNQIEFEDLMIFSFSYGFSNDHIYPESFFPNPDINSTIHISSLKSFHRQLQPRLNIPVKFIPISVDQIPDLKGFSITIELLDGIESFSGIEAVELLPGNNEGRTLLFHKVDGNCLTIDGAVCNKSIHGIRYQGVLFYLNLISGGKEAENIQIVKAIIRDSHNRDYKIEYSNKISITSGEYLLSQNYPNPFNKETNFKVQIPQDDYIDVSIYNMVGQQIRTLYKGIIKQGLHSFSWNSMNSADQVVPSGIYLLKMNATHFSKSKKMLLIK